MNIGGIDLGIILIYLVVVAVVGTWFHKKATKKVESFFLADRNIPWWMLGLSGSSSYIDISGTMAMVGLIVAVGLKSVWIIHIAWSLFIMSFYMAFQAKWIRRSSVMTFAEWNKTRFGNTRDAEAARLTSGIFVLVLMVFNLTYFAVGTGKFAEEFLPFERWQSTLVIFAIVGTYVTLGGFLGVMLTDILQTVLIAAGAILLVVIAFRDSGEVTQLIASKNPSWISLKPVWSLWSDYQQNAPVSYSHYQTFGPFMLAGLSWCIFRLLAGPNVWDFQFFLSARSPRDASLGAGLWTVGHTFRWLMIFSLLLIGIPYIIGVDASTFDVERIMPLAMLRLPVGLKGLFIAVLLAALMSTMSGAINVISNIAVNDFLKRYFAKNCTEKGLVRCGQVVCAVAIAASFVLNISFESVVEIWELMLFVVLMPILVPSTLRWHWWRFSAKAYVLSILISVSLIIGQKVFFHDLSASMSLGITVSLCFVTTLIAGLLCKPTDINTLIPFYVKVRPFGFWGPVKREAIKRRLIPEKDWVAVIDIANGILAMIFQMLICLVAFYCFLKLWWRFSISLVILMAVSTVLYFTWYKTLPEKQELDEIRENPD